MKNIHKIGNLIYIISNEKLPYDSSIFATGAFYHRDAAKCTHIITKDTFYPNPNFCSRIILTNDESLFKYGVQTIDDEFLEWFVKNPSCESVEIKKAKGKKNSWGYIPIINKIIIPQEEPKQEGYICPHTKIQCDDECCVSAEDCHITSSLASGMVDCKEPKQETLEEAAERMFALTDDDFKNYILNIQKNTWIAGAKWQAENMPIHILDVENTYVHIEDGVVIVEKNDKTKKSYTEEEVRELLLKFNDNKPGAFDASEWFEQFKKK
jgi:hypothetical protein